MITVRKDTYTGISSFLLVTVCQTPPRRSQCLDAQRDTFPDKQCSAIKIGELRV